ncbi:hypothetical protein GUJ93_ZPchr0005g15750 [Zizania palustris]|uniref:BHLH domain-containing protein n=1 Tax=Zizania palustris TaxID=103762 RepID=A0A8J5SKP9_ZIZPA|nr:hypothetical protein GUJ93_ZPchr0005g15750 [Zizania palustris]
MDGRSWMLQTANGDMRCGDTVRCSWAFAGDDPALRCDERMAMQQQLSQIYMLMDMDEHDGQYAPVAPPPSASSSFRSFSGTSQDDNSSSRLLTATSTTAAASCQNHHPEVSSQILPTYEYLSPIGASGAIAGVDVPYPEYSICHQEDQAQPGQARCRSRSGGHGATAAASSAAAVCAFRPYSRSLGPKKKLRPGGTAGGQRAIKTAMSVLSKMHATRLSQYYQIMEMASAAHALPSPAAAASRCDNDSQLQLQHVMSERKRREKLNDSFRALRAVLPPASKKDKASVLIRAKDYVNALMARITELEEKNKMLAESQHHAGDGEQYDEAAGNGSTEEVDIGKSAEAEATLPAVPGPCQELHLKIVLGSSSSSSGCSAMDAVAGILQGLNEMRDANLLAMNRGSTSSSNNGRLPRANTPTTQRPTVRLKLKVINFIILHVCFLIFRVH